jgi:signal transduction histidine kinase
MRDDSIQYAIDERRVRHLFAQDPIAFLTHWFAIAMLVTICSREVPNVRLFVVWLVFCGVVSAAQITPWIWHEHRADTLAPRSWIVLHTMCWASLYGAQGLSIWLVLDSRGAGSALLSAVTSAVLALAIGISIRFEIANLSMSIALLVPGVVLYFRSGTLDRQVVALVFAFVLVTINVYGFNYRKLFRRIVRAQVDQRGLAESLDLQKDVAEDAMTARTRFFELSSRELRQPLHSIGVLAGSLNDMTVTPAQRAQVAGRMMEKVDELNRFFDQLLDFARIESGLTPVKRMHFPLSELLDRIGERYWPQAAEKGLALRIAPTSEVVYEDPVLLEHVLGNLVSNAVRFTESGAIWIGFRRAGQRAGGYIEVRDSGIGIGPGEQQRLCGTVYPLANHQRDQGAGRGLGLAAVKMLAGLLGSELKMRSAPGRGSTFRLQVRAGDARQARTHLNDVVIVESPAARRQILCIGEERVIAEKLANRLGWVVQGANDESHARLLIEQGFSPDAVLCDCQPANLHTSAEALVAIRNALVRHGKACSLMLLMTGDIASTELEALALKGISVLQKTVSPARLLRTLAVLWQQCDRVDEAADERCTGATDRRPGLDTM